MRCAPTSPGCAPRMRKLKHRNQALEADVKDLKHNGQAVEARARSELGLIKPGETFYQVVGPASSSSSSHGQ